jgi:hypothetical protein
MQKGFRLRAASVVAMADGFQQEIRRPGISIIGQQSHTLASMRFMLVNAMIDQRQHPG